MPDIAVLNTSGQLSGRTLTTREGDWTVTGAWTFSGNQIFSGTVTCNGSVDLGDATTDNVRIIGSVNNNLLFTDATYDIGALGATRPRDLFLSRNLNVAGGQIVFPATQVASTDVNTLDDYEEGTWTPVLTFATPGNLSVVYTTQVGRYSRTGNVVHVQFNVTTSTFTHTTASGGCQITGLPFAHITQAGSANSMDMSWQGITKASYTQVSGRVGSGGSLIELYASGSGQSVSAVAAADMPTTGSVVFIGSGWYEVAT